MKGPNAAQGNSGNFILHNEFLHHKTLADHWPRVSPSLVLTTLCLGISSDLWSRLGVLYLRESKLSSKSNCDHAVTFLSWRTSAYWSKYCNDLIYSHYFNKYVQWRQADKFRGAENIKQQGCWLLKMTLLTIENKPEPLFLSTRCNNTVVSTVVNISDKIIYWKRESTFVALNV